MTITHHTDLLQGSDAWLAARCGLLTASEMKLILTPALKGASNDKARSHFWELLAQRITGHVEPRYISDDMLRGMEDEGDARKLYAARYAPVAECGFITNDEWGFTLGYSPDGMVGDDGLIEIKSRRQKFQVETILSGQVPDEYMMQIQTGLLVTGRAWCDFVSYSGGLPMATIRVPVLLPYRDAILEAAEGFETRMVHALADYAATLAAPDARLIPTERRIIEDMHA